MSAWKYAVILIVLGGSPWAWAQNKNPIRVEVPTVFGWSAPIAGEDGRPVAKVSGAKATPIIGTSLVDVSEFRLETYRYDPGKVTEIVFESPSGRFGGQGAESRDRLTLRSADDRFSVSGQGWSWVRAKELLIVSNAVETVLRRKAGSSNATPVSVRSGRFEYELRTGAARFLEDCVAEDPGRARVLAGELRSRLSPKQSAPEAILGTNGVIVELIRAKNPGRAQAEVALYSAASEGAEERIEMSGRARWSLGPTAGEADRLVLQPASEAYSAVGNAKFQLVPSGAKNRTAGAGRPGSRSIEVACESIEVQSTNVTFIGPLVARQGASMELKSERFEGVLGTDAATGDALLQSGVAVGRVEARVGTGERAVTWLGERMVYVGGERASIEVVGQPTWKGMGHRGRADRFRFDPIRETFEALGQVEVHWQGTKGSTNDAGVVLQSASMLAEGERVVFGGGVRASGTRWNLAAAEAELGLTTNRVVKGVHARREVQLQYEPPASKPASNAVAQAAMRRVGGDLARELRKWDISADDLVAGMAEGTEELTELDATGDVNVRHPAVHARGGRLTHAPADRLFRLLKNAELRMADGTEVLGMPDTALTMDPRTMRLGVVGPVRRMVLPSGLFRESGSTNSVRVP